VGDANLQLLSENRFMMTLVVRGRIFIIVIRVEIVLVVHVLFLVH
jgi:hypothetical protein